MLCKGDGEEDQMYWTSLGLYQTTKQNDGVLDEKRYFAENIFRMGWDPHCRHRLSLDSTRRLGIFSCFLSCFFERFGRAGTMEFFRTLFYLRGKRH
jgi:hypothetical protein